MQVVIEHLGGSRRGQRQELSPTARVRFGRHPDCEVSFDPVRDLDASSRHAELRSADPDWVLVDLGSSNGTFVDGRRITEARVEAGAPVVVEFGHRGPRVRLFIGDPAELAALPLPPPPAQRRHARWWPVLLGGLVLVVAGVVVLLLARG